MTNIKTAGNCGVLDICHLNLIRHDDSGIHIFAITPDSGFGDYQMEQF